MDLIPFSPLLESAFFSPLITSVPTSLIALLITSLAFLTALPTLHLSTFLPTNLLSSISRSTASIIASASSISFCVKTFSAPDVPWVSTFTSYPNSFPVTSKFSAAINVCAIPVGHAVTATIFLAIFLSSFY